MTVLPQQNKNKAPSTRDRLKITARQLFAEHGVDGVTVRDILSAADERNGASLNYYFRSKDDLIREIIVDLFTFFDQRWGSELEALEKRSHQHDIREYIRLLVRVADTTKDDAIPTVSRLAEVFSTQRHDMVLAVLKEHKLVNYDHILAGISACLSHLPPEIVRQRLVFVTRYLSSIFALYESARVHGSSRKRGMLRVDYEMGNVIDTAVGLLTAAVVEPVMDEASELEAS